MAASASIGSSATLDQNQFLQLLVAQMKSQDPMSPTSNSDFIGQLAQFSTLSGIETMNSNFSNMLTLQELTQGSSLVGKSVTYTNANNQVVTGTAQSVALHNGTFQIQVGSDNVSLSQISSVK